METLVDSNIETLPALLRNNARMLLDTLLEVRTLVKPGGRAHTLIDEACAKIGVVQ